MKPNYTELEVLIHELLSYTAEMHRREFGIHQPLLAVLCRHDNWNIVRCWCEDCGATSMDFVEKFGVELN